MMCRASHYAEKLRNMRGWRRNLAAFGLGILAMFTLAPFYIFPLLIPAFSGLYILIDNAPTKRRMFWDGWFWGWGYYMSGLYWFCVALLTDDAFAWLIPFALFGLTGVIAIYSGIACWCMFFIKKHISGAGRITAFVLVYTATEIARGHLFTGFPWNLLGYSFGFSDASLQLASIFGPYGLTMCALLIGLSPLFIQYNKAITATIWLLLAAGITWGSLRLPNEAMPTVTGTKLRLIQANISQPHKWDPKRQLNGLQLHIALMLSPGIEDVTHIIWPETAVPYVIQPHSPLSQTLGSAIPEGKILITGGLRAEGEDHKTMKIWNSLMAINHLGEIIGVYDKAHLVPFGEFQPIRPYVPKSWMTPVGEKDFAWGTASQVLNWGNLPPLLPLICYEVIFPEMAQSPSARPAWLLNVTNDAWFGTSTGPHQHFEMARMRAVEQGVPLVRVANTGISAVIDPYGRITASLALGTQGVLDTQLPQALEQPTIYTLWQYMLLSALALALLAFSILHRKV